MGYVESHFQALEPDLRAESAAPEGFPLALTRVRAREVMPNSGYHGPNCWHDQPPGHNSLDAAQHRTRAAYAAEGTQTCCPALTRPASCTDPNGISSSGKDLPTPSSTLESSGSTAPRTLLSCICRCFGKYGRSPTFRRHCLDVTDPLYLHPRVFIDGGQALRQRQCGWQCYCGETAQASDPSSSSAMISLLTNNSVDPFSAGFVFDKEDISSFKRHERRGGGWTRVRSAVKKGFRQIGNRFTCRRLKTSLS